jgi:hypothetical protein
MINKIILLSFILSAVILTSCSSDEKTIGLNQMLQHDDFFYSVLYVETASMIEGKKANGTFYIVKFKVQNDAKRVSHEWKNNVAYITDDKGREFENNNDLQKLLNSAQPFGYKDTYITNAGTSESTLFIFDVPNDVKEPYLRYRGEYLMGDMFDGNRFKNTKVKLF